MRPRDFFLVLTIALLCMPPAFCQESPDISLGVNPYVTFQGGQIDSVNMITGRLSLHIPL
jgi:hypothetical protein